MKLPSHCVWYRMYCLAASLLVAAIVPAGELKINVTSFPPGQPIQPGTAVLLSVEGLDDGQTAIWHRVAMDGDVVLTLGDQFLFAGTEPGMRTFTVQVASPGVDPFAIASFAYGVPDVNPPTPPVPPVPTPGDYVQVIVIEEQYDRTRNQAEVLDDPVWQLAVLAAGATYRIEDDDLKIRDPATRKDVTPAWLRTVLAAIAKAEVDLPAVCFVGEDGEVTSVVALPENVEAMRELVE